MELDHFSEAIADARKSLDLDPKVSKGYYKLGKVYKKQGHFEKAVEEFHRGLNIQADPLILKELEDTQLLMKY